MTVWRGLALPWDEALTTLSAVIRIGPDAPGVDEWIESTRAIYRGFEATPMLILLDGAVARGGATPDARPLAVEPEATAPSADPSSAV